MPRYALDERSDLADSLRTAGPDAPTLCGDWTTSQLAGHLVLREKSITEVLGRIPSGRLQALAQRSIDRYVAGRTYEQLVAEVAAGPPVLSPFAFAPLRENVNLLEYLVHNEDVRRAVLGWQPRAVPVDRQRAVWSKLRLAAKLTLRSVPLPVRLAWPAHGAITVGSGEPRVTVTGDPVELALLSFGRQRVAGVDYAGTPQDVAAVRGAEIAI